MGVAVLHPQGYFKAPLFPRDRPPPPMKRPIKSKAEPSPNSKSARPSPKLKSRPSSRPPKTNRTHHNLSRESPKKAPTASPTGPAKELFVGQVRILKRGEEITSTTETTASPQSESRAATAVEQVKSPARESVQSGLLPKPEFHRPSAISDGALPGFYAGTAFIVSPPPSSVPMPAFFTKRSGESDGFDDATSGLRRLLRLDLD